MSSVFVIDGQSRSRDRIVQFLSGEGHVVEQFEDASAALAAIDNANTPVDMAIVAWDIPGPMNGAEFLLRLKQRRASFSRIVVSEVVDLDLRNRAFALGAVDLLLKPVDGDRLRKSVRRVLKDPKEVDPLVAELREHLIGDSPVFLEAVVKLSQAIHNEKPTVLLIGESGVGKEDFAQLIHRKGSRPHANIEAVNLAGLSATLIESELFGHEKGAFTGADRRHAGAFERASKSTLFLDEIGYLDLALQPKLLRAVQQRKFLRVGGSEPIDFEGRLVLCYQSQPGRGREDWARFAKTYTTASASSRFAFLHCGSGRKTSDRWSNTF